MSHDKAIDNDTITFRSPTIDDLPALRKIIAEVYARKEPILKYANVSVTAFLTGYDQLAQHFDLYTSSIAALPSGEIVAAFFGLPLDAAIDGDAIDKEVLNVYQSLVNPDPWFVERFDLTGVGATKRVLHLVLGTTADEYENRGLSKRLRAETIRKAKEAGWDYAVVECSNVKTQHLMRDVFGFEVGKEVKFSDCEADGTRPLDGMEGTAILLYSDLKK